MHLAWMTDQMVILFTGLGQKQMEGLVRINDEFHFSQVELEVPVEGEVQQEPGICYKIKRQMWCDSILWVVRTVLIVASDRT